jgi:hypothetical protein
VLKISQSEKKDRRPSAIKNKIKKVNNQSLFITKRHPQLTNPTFNQTMREFESLFSLLPELLRSPVAEILILFGSTIVSPTVMYRFRLCVDREASDPTPEVSDEDSNVIMSCQYLSLLLYQGLFRSFTASFRNMC